MGRVPRLRRLWEDWFDRGGDACRLLDLLPDCPPAGHRAESRAYLGLRHSSQRVVSGRARALARSGAARVSQPFINLSSFSGLRPLLNSGELDNVKKMAIDFLQPSGMGPKLQAILQRKYNDTENWVNIYFV